MKRVRFLLVVFIIIIISGGVYSNSPAGEETAPSSKEKAVSTTPEASPTGTKATVTTKTDPGVSVIAPSGKKPDQPQNEKKTAPEAQADKKATLTLKKGKNK